MHNLHTRCHSNCFEENLFRINIGMKSSQSQYCRCSDMCVLVNIHVYAYI